ncbi:importin-13 [Lepeophtheirus salmonis]|uniref:Importin-13 n=1 Tax=Lepeophtheirus salmonis TaxID=72036 RepID=A0A0K2V652_LEPSM|nr:importin-13-like [Lepeophtheirus salmonis]
MDNQDISAASVERTVLQFYRTPSPELQTWLTNAQHRGEAWSWSWDLLSSNGPSEVVFFGASTLALKLTQSWNEIPPDSHAPLREKLLNVLAAYRGPKIVITRLCVAGAILAVRGTADGIWDHPITDLINGFGPENPILLELFTVIPEEFTTLSLPGRKRAIIHEKLGKVIPDVFSVIRRTLASNGDAKVQAIKCFQAWSQFETSLENSKDIINTILRSLEDESLFDVGLEALSTVVGHPDTYRYPNHLKEILNNILQLDGMLYGFLREGSFELANPLITLFVTFGESHSRLLIDWSTNSDREMVLRLINIFLSVSGVEAVYPIQETLSEMPFGFWYILQDDIISCEPPQFQQCVSLYGPIYGNLVDLLLKKSMYRLDEDKWTEDQRERFRCYRTDIADTIMYCYNILRDDLLKNLLKHLEESIQRNLTDSKNNWAYLEATLYAWSSIAGSMVEEDECEIVSLFLAKLPVVPYNNIRVISTALDCIGGFSDWLAQRPQLLHHVFPIVTGALENPELSLCATMALKDISRDCIDAMIPYVDSVIESCTRALNSNTYAFGECIRLMYPIGRMLTLLPYDQIIPRLEPILAPHLVKLGALVSEEPSLQNRPRIIFYLKMVSNLFSALDISKKENHHQQQARPQQPIASILPQIMPMLRFIAEKWALDTNVSENLCDLLKQSIGTLLDEAKPFVQDIVSIVLSSYQSRPHSAALDLARQFFVMFGEDVQLQPVINSLFVKLCERTLTEVSSTGNLSDHTDLVAPFFEMLTHVLKKQSKLFASQEEGVISSVFNCAMTCVSLPEDCMVKYSVQFLVHFINISRDHNRLLQVVNNQGQNLFMITIKCIGGEGSRNFTDYYADILVAFNKKYFDNHCRWMEGFVNMENFPTDKLNRAQKEHFGQLILRERVNKRRIMEIVKEFSLACLGLVGTGGHMGQVMATWERVEEHEARLKEIKAIGAANKK